MHALNMRYLHSQACDNCDNISTMFIMSNADRLIGSTVVPLLKDAL